MNSTQDQLLHDDFFDDAVLAAINKIEKEALEREQQNPMQSQQDQQEQPHQQHTVNEVERLRNLLHEEQRLRMEADRRKSNLQNQLKFMTQHSDQQKLAQLEAELKRVQSTMVYTENERNELQNQMSLLTKEMEKERAHRRQLEQRLQSTTASGQPPAGPPSTPLTALNKKKSTSTSSSPAANLNKSTASSSTGATKKKSTTTSKKKEEPSSSRLPSNVEINLLDQTPLNQQQEQKRRQRGGGADGDEDDADEFDLLDVKYSERNISNVLLQRSVDSSRRRALDPATAGGAAEGLLRARPEFTHTYTAEGQLEASPDTRLLEVTLAEAAAQAASRQQKRKHDQLQAEARELATVQADLHRVLTAAFVRDKQPVSLVDLAHPLLFFLKYSKKLRILEASLQVISYLCFVCKEFRLAVGQSAVSHGKDFVSSSNIVNHGGGGVAAVAAPNAADTSPSAIPLVSPPPLTSAPKQRRAKLKLTFDDDDDDGHVGNGADKKSDSRQSVEDPCEWVPEGFELESGSFNVAYPKTNHRGPQQSRRQGRGPGAAAAVPPSLMSPPTTAVRLTSSVECESACLELYLDLYPCQILEFAVSRVTSFASIHSPLLEPTLATLVACSADLDSCPHTWFQPLYKSELFLTLWPAPTIQRRSSSSSSSDPAGVHHRRRRPGARPSYRAAMARRHSLSVQVDAVLLLYQLSPTPDFWTCLAWSPSHGINGGSQILDRLANVWRQFNQLVREHVRFTASTSCGQHQQQQQPLDLLGLMADVDSPLFVARRGVRMCAALVMAIDQRFYRHRGGARDRRSVLTDRRVQCQAPLLTMAVLEALSLFCTYGGRSVGADDRDNAAISVVDDPHAPRLIGMLCQLIVGLTKISGQAEAMDCKRHFSQLKTVDVVAQQHHDQVQPGAAYTDSQPHTLHKTALALARWTPVVGSVALTVSKRLLVLAKNM